MPHKKVQVDLEEEIWPLRPHINTHHLASFGGISSHIHYFFIGSIWFEIAGSEFIRAKERETIWFDWVWLTFWTCLTCVDLRRFDFVWLVFGFVLGGRVDWDVDQSFLHTLTRVDHRFEARVDRRSTIDFGQFEGWFEDCFDWVWPSIRGWIHWLVDRT